MDKLNIHNEMAQLDRKNRDFYDELTDDERKKFSNYLMIRWGSSVSGTQGLQEFYVQSINECLNKHFFSINRHPKLQWLCATAASADEGKLNHTWIAGPKREKAARKIIKELAEFFPSAKISDLECLDEINDDRALRQWMRDHGNDA